MSEAGARGAAAGTGPTGGAPDSPRREPWGPSGGSAIRIGTRGSALALAQSRQVGDLIAGVAGRPVELVPIRTRGDSDPAPLTQIGGTGVFVTAVRQALLDGVIDVAVHSYKDLPTADDPRILLAAVPPREHSADVLCAAHGWAFDGLPAGARVGTGSPRRAAQLLRLRRDLQVVGVRGNADSRLAAVADGRLDAVVLARAGLARLGRLDAVTHTFTPADMLPAPAQGALAVECRAGSTPDADLGAMLAAIDDPASRAATLAERAVLAGLQAGCAAPVGALATVADGHLVLSARVVAVDGGAVREYRADGPVERAAAIGAEAAAALLADGAATLMGRA